MFLVLQYFSRNSVGLHPLCLRNRRLKLLKLLNPQVQQISLILSVVSTRRRATIIINSIDDPIDASDAAAPEIDFTDDDLVFFGE